jgi:hypothetical protein
LDEAAFRRQGRHPVERGSGPSTSACRLADEASIWCWELLLSREVPGQFTHSGSGLEISRSSERLNRFGLRAEGAVVRKLCLRLRPIGRLRNCATPPCCAHAAWGALTQSPTIYVALGKRSRPSRIGFPGLRTQGVGPDLMVGDVPEAAMSQARVVDSSSHRQVGSVQAQRSTPVSGSSIGGRCLTASSARVGWAPWECRC